MIRKEEIFEAGKFHKTHGVKGELSCSFSFPVDSSKLSFIVSNIEGIYVPFFIEDMREKTSTSLLLKLKNINTDEDAKFLLDSPIYLPNELRKTDDEEVDVAYFIHFTVVDANCGKIGVITAIDDSTPNTLFCVDTEQGEALYIPVAEEFFLSIDESTKTIYMDLPTGLLTLNL